MTEIPRKLAQKVLRVIRRDDAEGIKHLIRDELKINQEIRGRHWEPLAPLLAHACEQKSFHVANYLIEAGAEIDKGRQYPALLAAVRSGSKRITRLLLDSGADPNIKALSNGNPAPSPETDRDSGWTP